MPEVQKLLEIVKRNTQTQLPTKKIKKISVSMVLWCLSYFFYQVYSFGVDFKACTGSAF